MALGYPKKSLQLVLEETDDAYVSIHDNLKFLEDNSFYGRANETALTIFITMSKMES